MFDPTSLIAQFGLLAVFGTAAVEGDAAVVTAGVLVQRELLPLWPVVIAGMAGGWFSDLLIYHLARRFRERDRTKRAVEAARKWRFFNLFVAYPMLLALAIRFMPGVRTAGPVALATATEITPLRYAVLTGIAAFLWSLILVHIGHQAGELIARLLQGFGVPEYLVIGIPVAIVLVLTVFAVRKWRRRAAGREV
ncbi:DedA family protein [Pseudorhodobacter sp.]|uniref:DedA family protein n=1 Tax=Pseudorhodobacter sp. TaxID=1934400 RepID=UPI00264793A2|nr:VTT domain-containing protein [Pseudorhodobacter sp.]MDN5787963.1 VTT domain-containing protein [Pseudorhodobacter sp.]